MRFSFALPALAASLVAAVPAPIPQDIDLDLVAKLPDPTYTEAVGVTAQVVTYNPTSLAAQATAAISSVSVDVSDVLSGTAVANKQKRSACAPQPAGATGAPKVSPDTPSAFARKAAFASTALRAPSPQGYTRQFSNLNAASSAYGYLGYTSLQSYDTASCAKKCDAIDGCVSFNIYFERDPSVDPGSGCEDPPSVVSIKCAFWGSPVSLSNANNFGQYRDKFQVLIRGSNGYTSKSVLVPSGYTSPQYLGDAAINAPWDVQGYNTYMGSRVFTQGGFSAQLCADYCTSQSKYNVQHAPRDGTPPKVCHFFNTYMLYLNKTIPQGQYCSLYTETWSPRYATNAGQYRGHDQYTVSWSYTYTSKDSPGFPPRVGDKKGAIHQAVTDMVYYPKSLTSTFLPFCTSIASPRRGARVSTPEILSKYPATVVYSACGLIAAKPSSTVNSISASVPSLTPFLGGYATTSSTSSLSSSLTSSSATSSSISSASLSTTITVSSTSSETSTSTLNIYTSMFTVDTSSSTSDAYSSSTTDASDSSQPASSTTSDASSSTTSDTSSSTTSELSSSTVSDVSSSTTSDVSSSITSDVPSSTLDSYTSTISTADPSSSSTSDVSSSITPDILSSTITDVSSSTTSDVSSSTTSDVSASITEPAASSSTFEASSSTSEASSTSSEASTVTVSPSPTITEPPQDAYDVITSESLEPFCSDFLGYSVLLTTVYGTSLTTTTTTETDTTLETETSTTISVSTETDYVTATQSTTVVASDIVYTTAPFRRRDGGNLATPTALSGYAVGDISSGCSRAVATPDPSTITVSTSETVTESSTTSTTTTTTTTETSLSATTEVSSTTTIVTSTITVPLQTQVVVNPSFETGDNTSPWVYSGNGLSESNTNNAYQSYDGSWFGVLYGRSSTTPSLSQSLVGLKGGAQYTLSYYYNVEQASPQAICTLTTTIGGTVVDTVTSPTVRTGRYINRSVGYTAASDSAVLTFKLTCPRFLQVTAQSNYAFDAITLTYS